MFLHFLLKRNEVARKRFFSISHVNTSPASMDSNALDEILKKLTTLKTNKPPHNIDENEDADSIRIIDEKKLFIETAAKDTFQYISLSDIPDVSFSTLRGNGCTI